MSKLKMNISFVYLRDDEPIAIRIIPSSWSDPQMYHVLKEYGEYEQTEYLGLFDRNQISEKFMIEIPEQFDLSEIIKTNPNDYTLCCLLREIESNLNC